ncbi:MAG: hypothetical protein ABIJ41_04095 [Candidatus Omnitrophota bacterium]
MPLRRLKYNPLCLLVCAAVCLLFFVSHSQAQEEVPLQEKEGFICTAYISGIGCGNCAVTDPVVFTQWTQKYPNLVILEYEIYKSREDNKDTKDAYFFSYLPMKRSGVPFFVIDKKRNFVGKIKVLEAEADLRALEANPCPLVLGAASDFEQLDLTTLPGKVNIWTKNRVLVSGKKADPQILKKVLIEEDISKALKNVHFKKIHPETMPISNGQIGFQYAVQIGDWRLQWNGEPLKVSSSGFVLSDHAMSGILIVVILLLIAFFFFRIQKTKKGFSIHFRMERKRKELMITLAALVGLIVVFAMARSVSPKALEQAGYNMPLPIFTFLIALVDGFNPCNMFVLTCLLALLISTSDAKKRLFAVALSFVFVVFIIYFLFMAAWLNVFKYFSFVTPLRIAIALIAIVAGLINCKELLFFRKGISLMIQEEHKEPLMDKMRGMKEIIRTGSFPVLISSSIGLAAFSSLIELPCTAGFPIIYTGILSGRFLKSTFAYYSYLFLYNFVYVIPLLVIITIFIYTFKAKAISKEQIQMIKFIGGFIMILLGIVLLVNPGLIGLGAS